MALLSFISVYEVMRSTEAAQPDYDAPHKRRRQTGGKVADCRTLADLRQGRIRHDDTGKGPDIEPLGNGQGPGGDQLARMGADDGGAENPAAARGDDLDVPAGFAD